MSDSGRNQLTGAAAEAQRDEPHQSGDIDLRPPKQRYKEHAQSEAAGSPEEAGPPRQHDKRPLSDVLNEAEEEIVAAAAGCGGSPLGLPPDSNGFPGASHSRQAKQPRQQDSLIRNIARPHKPRIGPEYQAELPPFNPNRSAPP
jgi:hypothetical protein